MTVVGTRPEIIRLSRIIEKLENYSDHILVHTGQNYDYELNQIFFEDLEIKKPDHFLETGGSVYSETIGQIIISIDSLLSEIKPDALLVLGDTNSCLSAYPAKRRKIPVFHIEAGNRCFDERVPEEINRRIVDHISDINLTYSSIAREYLLKEGFSPERVIKVGSPMNEVLTYYRGGIDSSKILTKLNLTKKKFFLVSAHREENIESDINFTNLVKLLNKLGEKFNQPVIVSTHPRTKKRIDSTGVKFNENINLIKPLGFKDYNKLQLSARVVLSDSGTITEESSIMNFPALNIRDSHERLEGMEEGAVMMVGLDINRVLQGLSILNDQPREEKRIIQPVSDYNVPNVSDKVLRIIVSYIDYVNHFVWHKK